MVPIILASLLAMTASLVGVIAVWRRAGRAIERNADFLISFSAGVFLVIAYNIANEAVEHASTLGSGLLWIFFGALGIWVLFKLLPALHVHRDEEDEEEAHHPIDVRRMLVGDAFHNIGDGILLAASFAVDTSLGIAAAFSVFIHELVQELSEFFVLRAAGYTARQALTLNFIISSTVLVGSVGGYFLLESFEVLEGPFLGLAAGAFLVVVLHDLIPHSVRSSSGRLHYVKHLVWFVVGIALMAGVSTLVAHQEPEVAATAPVVAQA